MTKNEMLALADRLDALVNAKVVIEAVALIREMAEQEAVGRVTVHPSHDGLKYDIITNGKAHLKLSLTPGGGLQLLYVAPASEGETE